MMNILLSGGAGYIGSHAVRHLVELGHRVVVIDNLSKGHRASVHSEAVFKLGDINDSSLIKNIVKEYSIEGVISFAASTEVAESVAHPEKYYANNFSATLSFLKTLIDNGVCKFVFSSTASVYAGSNLEPITESQPTAPRNPYGQSKRMIEAVLADFAVAYGLGYTVLRYFNVAGAHPDATIGEDHRPESHLIPSVLLAVQQKKIIFPVYGSDYPTPDGSCVRDYIHVQDVVRAHSLALEKIKPGVGNIYNLGSDRGFSVLEVIKACQKITGLELKIENHLRRPGDPAILIASSEKISRELGWRPEYPEIGQMIEHAWRWHQAHPHGY